jgi:spore maturation protein CgeB
MACIPDIHTRKDVSDEERRNYKCDVAFVGSLNPSIYPFRIQTLEHLSGLNLSIWGPGSRLISENSPLYKHVRGTQVSPDIWTKIYSCAKIVLCMHYKDPRGTVACYQSSPRVFEALSCGAFLIVDEQKDVMSLFENERHLVYFHNADDLRQKIQYYLSHGEKRENIAKNGYTFVRENHTYAHRIKELLSNIEGHE